MIDFQALAAPFPPEVVSWRVGSSNKKRRIAETGDKNAKATKGQALAYIDARDVMERLDEVCGPENWQATYSHADKKTVCELAIWVEGRGWVAKANGAGDSDIEAEKGAMSDAFKRAAVLWGIGRYLYDIDSPWVDLDEWEQITPASKARLRQLLANKAPLPRRAAAEAEPEPQPNGALTLAEGLIGRSGTLAELSEFWTKNYPAWRQTLTPDELDRLTRAKDARKAELSAPEQRAA